MKHFIISNVLCSFFISRQMLYRLLRKDWAPFTNFHCNEHNSCHYIVVFSALLIKCHCQYFNVNIVYYYLLLKDLTHYFLYISHLNCYKCDTIWHLDFLNLIYHVHPDIHTITFFLVTWYTTWCGCTLIYSVYPPPIDSRWTFR